MPLLKAALKTELGTSVEIIAGVERRRRWRSDERRRVLAELEAPDVTVTEVARRHDISRGLIWTWSRQARRQATASGIAEFLPMQVALGGQAPMPVRIAKSGTCNDSTIEIRLPDGTIVRVGSEVTAAALRRVLTALRG